jgi:hypothetical protein
MQIDANSRVCPICGYEFPVQSAGYKWVAWLLVMVIVFYFVLRIF